MNLVAGQNELDISLVSIPPAIDLVSLSWDAIPPFETSSSHVWTVAMKNLVSFPVTYQLEMYMNGVHFMGETVYLVGDGVKVSSQPKAFGVAGTYTLTIKAYYREKLLDEISSTTSVESPPAPVVLGGEVLIGYVRWAGLPSDKQIVPFNEWPSNTNIQMSFKVKNTGNITASFFMVFIGVSNTISLAPGESGWVEMSVVTPPLPTVAGYNATLNANYQVVDQDTLQVKYV